MAGSGLGGGCLDVDRSIRGPEASSLHLSKLFQKFKP